VPTYRRPGVALASLPHIDHVIATHLHADHFERKAVARFGHPKMEIVGTVGTKDYCADLDIGAVHELLPWEEHRLGPFEITATPCEHTGPPPPEINYVIEVGGLSVFFGGDARWSDAFQQIHDRLGPVDIALVPIGGTLIFGHRTTMAPQDAARACHTLGARWAIPIHEGGEWFSLPPASWHPGRNIDFVKALKTEAPRCRPRVLERGQSAIFPT
jgi:L-ascorbate metabolism protein UlaG (beta-lactamase superfamily)